MAIALISLQIQPRYDRHRHGGMFSSEMLNRYPDLEQLPYSLVDFCYSTVTAVMGAALMCVSAGYFAAVLPPVVLAVWS